MYIYTPPTGLLVSRFQNFPILSVDWYRQSLLDRFGRLSNSVASNFRLPISNYLAAYLLL